MVGLKPFELKEDNRHLKHQTMEMNVLYTLGYNRLVCEGLEEKHKFLP